MDDKCDKEFESMLEEVVDAKSSSSTGTYSVEPCLRLMLPGIIAIVALLLNLVVDRIQIFGEFLLHGIQFCFQRVHLQFI